MSDDKFNRVISSIKNTKRQQKTTSTKSIINHKPRPSQYYNIHTLKAQIFLPIQNTFHQPGNRSISTQQLPTYSHDTPSMSMSDRSVLAKNMSEK